MSLSEAKERYVWNCLHSKTKVRKGALCKAIYNYGDPMEYTRKWFDRLNETLGIRTADYQRR